MRPTLRDVITVLIVLATAVVCVGYLMAGGMQALRGPWVLTAGLTDWLLVALLLRAAGHRRLMQAQARAHHG